MAQRRFDITEPAQLEAMALPIRAELVDLVSGLGPMSCREIAAMLGKRRPAIHYQVNVLLETGLLVPAGTRGSGRDQVDLVRTPAREMRLSFDPSDDLVVAHMVTHVRLALQRAQRLLGRAFRSRQARTRGPHRDTRITQSTCRLNRDQLASVNRMIDALVAEASPTEADLDGTHYLLTVALAPLESRT
ncbi:MAG: helix-turn-helix domain-containing protein [Planctomycetota bacterium]